MFFPITPEDPIVVIVREGEWESYSLHDPPTERDKKLVAVMRRMGGIAMEVEPGVYHFNIVHLDEKNLLAQLEPIRGSSRIFHAL